MEKAIINAKAALKVKEETNPIADIFEKRSTKTGKQHIDVPFASIMDEKSAVMSLSISRPASTQSAPNYKMPPFITGDIPLDGKDESAIAGKAPKGKEGGDCCIPSPDGTNEPVRVGLDKTTSEKINECPVPERVVAVFAEMPTLIHPTPLMSVSMLQDEALLAGVEKKSLPLIEGTGFAPSSISAAKSTGLPIRHIIRPSGPLPVENANQADPTPAEIAVRDTAPFSPSFLQTAGKASLQEDPKYFHKTAIRNEATVKASTVTVARMDSPHPEKTLTYDDPVTASPSGENKFRPTETGFINRVAEIMRQKDNIPAADSVIADLRRLIVSNQDNKLKTSTPKEPLLISTAVQKTLVSGSEKGTAMKQDEPDRVTRVTLADRAVNMKNSLTVTADSSRDHERNEDLTPFHSVGISERESLAFRTEMSNIYSALETHITASDGPAAIHTQAVIDKILDAKQAMNNNFGRVRIVLDPPNLGTVDLEIVIRKERVEIVMTADNANVQQALQSRTDDIRMALQRQDLKIETFQVLLQDPATNQQQAHGGAMFEQHRERQTRQNNIEDSVPIPSVLSTVAESEPANGLVSVFV